MKTLFLISLIASLALTLAGCGDSHASMVTQAEPVPASIYKEGYGVQLTEKARQFIGLQTGEVVSHTFASAAEVPSIPANALLRTVKGDFVYVINGSWFLRVEVTAGATDKTHIEVKDGLYEGDAIVIQGVRGLALAEIQALNGGIGCADGH